MTFHTFFHKILYITAKIVESGNKDYITTRFQILLIKKNKPCFCSMLIIWVFQKFDVCTNCFVCLGITLLLIGGQLYYTTSPLADVLLIFLKHNNTDTATRQLQDTINILSQ